MERRALLGNHLISSVKDFGYREHWLGVDDVDRSSGKPELATFEEQREMTEKMSAELVIDTRNSIGEGPAWDAAKDRLLWTDIPAGVIYSSSSTNGNLWPVTQTWKFDRPVSVVVPSASGGLVAAVGTDVLAIQEDGTTTVLAHLAFDPAVVRINDGKCDPQGRLWLGTLSLDGRSGAGAALYRLDADGTLNTMIEDVVLSKRPRMEPRRSQILLYRHANARNRRLRFSSR